MIRTLCVLMGIGAFIAGQAAALETMKGGVGYVAAEEAAQLIQQIDDLIVLDVRTPPEFEAGRIEGALHVDYLSPDFKSEASKLDPDTPYLVYCASGRRSAGAVSVLKGLDFETIYHLDHGMKGWEQAGLPTVSDKVPGP